MNADDLKMFGGLAGVLAFLFFGNSGGLKTIYNLVSKLIPRVPSPIKPITDLDFSLGALDTNDTLAVHRTIGELIVWFQQRKDEKGVLAAKALGQHVYDMTIEIPVTK